jgi:hypothetical protein
MVFLRVSAETSPPSTNQRFLVAGHFKKGAIRGDLEKRAITYVKATNHYEAASWDLCGPSMMLQETVNI